MPRTRTVPPWYAYAESALPVLTWSGLRLGLGLGLATLTLILALTLALTLTLTLALFRHPYPYPYPYPYPEAGRCRHPGIRLRHLRRRALHRPCSPEPFI